MRSIIPSSAVVENFMAIFFMVFMFVFFGDEPEKRKVDSVTVAAL